MNHTPPPKEKRKRQKRSVSGNLNALLTTNGLLLVAMLTLTALAGMAVRKEMKGGALHHVPSGQVASLMTDPKRSMKETVALVEYTYKLQDATAKTKADTAKLLAGLGVLLAGIFFYNLALVLGCKTLMKGYPKTLWPKEPEEPLGKHKREDTKRREKERKREKKREKKDGTGLISAGREKNHVHISQRSAATGQK